MFIDKIVFADVDLYTNVLKMFQ